MKKFLLFVLFLIGVFVCFFVFPDGAVATVISSGLFILTLLLIDRVFEAKTAEFLKKVVLIGMLLRILTALFIYAFELETAFGPDALTFDLAGRRIVDYYAGALDISAWGVEKALSFTDTGWGMNYFVAGFYYMSGANRLAIQFISCVFGTATIPAVYFCANKIFNNIRVAKYSALALALFPAMILWSSQMLKDGFILFFIVLSMACIIQLYQKFNILPVFLLLVSLFALYALRSYIFYMVAASIVGSFIVGAGRTSAAVGKRMAVLLVLVTAVGYFGFGSSGVETEGYSLARLQEYRYYQAEGGAITFGEDYDISTVEGTATLLPIGIVNILFAPFPWQMGNIRQAIIAPEMLVWWICIPFLISGIRYTLKHRLREAIPILTFSGMLTVAYALFQSNIGAAYRQRTQIQVFLFIFVAVGWTMYKENKENKDFTYQTKRKKIVTGF